MAYAWATETRFFREIFVTHRKFGQKPGFFVGVRKLCLNL